MKKAEELHNDYLKTMADEIFRFLHNSNVRQRNAFLTRLSDLQIVIGYKKDGFVLTNSNVETVWDEMYKFLDEKYSGVEQQILPFFDETSGSISQIRPINKNGSKLISLLIFLAALTYSSDQREEILGHIRERYNKELKLYGQYYAMGFLVKDTFESLYPVIKAIIHSKILQVLKHLGLYKVISYFIN